MGKRIWRRRVAALLTVCMLATQFAVPVLAQGTNATEAEKIPVPTEYETIDVESADGMLDLSEIVAEEETKKQQTGENEAMESIATYGSIPIVGNGVAEDEKTPPAAYAEAQTEAAKMRAVSEEEVPALAAEEDGGELTLGKSIMASIDIPGEGIGYTYVPEESGSYVLTSWVEGENISSYLNVYVYDSNLDDWVFMGNVWERNALLVELTAGNTYKVVADVGEQGDFWFRLSKAETISENPTTINSAGVYTVNPEDGYAKKVQLSVGSENGETYYLSANGNILTKSEDGFYEFYCSSSQTILLWKTTDTEDIVSVSMKQEEVPKVTMTENEVSLTKDVSFAQNKIIMEFTPASKGYYGFAIKGFLNGYSSSLYEKTENGSVYCTWYTTNSMICAELEENKTYIIEMGGTVDLEENQTMLIEKLADVTSSLATETKLSPVGTMAMVKFPAIAEKGIYQVKVKGAASQVRFQIIGNNGEMGLTYSGEMTAYKGNDGVRTLYITESTEETVLCINSSDMITALGDLTVSINENDNVLVSDTEDNCAKKAVTLTTADDLWVSFEPAVTGDYVFCTEKKYSDRWTQCELYKANESGDLECIESSGSWDNVHVIYHLEAGSEYFSKLNQYMEGDDILSEDINVVLYPVEEVAYSGTAEVKTKIRKAVTYTMEVPAAGFYKLNVNGNEESYLLKITSDDEDMGTTATDSFVYNGIPRVFQFAKKGTYEIQVMKELMSDSADEITFSCTTEGALNVLGGSEYVTINIDNTDGAWVEYIPEQSGWYVFEAIDAEEMGINVELSVVSEDGSEIVYSSWGSSAERNWETGEMYYPFYLKKDRTYYYKIYPDWETTGEVKVRMHSAEKTMNFDDETISDITTTNKLVHVTTNFTQEQYFKLDWDGEFSVYIKNITEGQNDSFGGINAGDILVFPAGESDWLFYLCGDGERTVSVEKWEFDYSWDGAQTMELTKEESDKWIKFEPSETGFYNVVADTEYKDISVSTYMKDSSYVTSYSGMDSYSNTAYFYAGTTYFYQVAADDIPEGETVDVILKLNKVEVEQAIGGAEYQISMNQIYLAEVNVDPDVYYQITKDSEMYGKYRFSWITVDKNGNAKLVKKTTVSKDVTNITLPAKYWKNGKKLYVLISKSKYSDPAERFEFGFKKAEIIQTTLTFGETVSQCSTGAIKEYEFTPEEDGRYSFIITSDDEAASDIDCSIRYTDGSGNYIRTYESGEGVNLTKEHLYEYQYSYELVAGNSYTLQILAPHAYNIKVTKTIPRVVFDYDTYNAFVASGGTINFVDSVTEEMWDEPYVDYWGLGDEYICIDTSGFEDLSNRWYLEDWLIQYSAEKDTISYDMLNDYYKGIDHKLYVPKTWYKTDSNDATKYESVSLGQIVGDERIILLERQPAVVLVQEINLSGVTALDVGQSAKLTATTSTLNKYEPTTPGVTFVSSNPAVISVDSSGTMTAKAEGTVTITCKSLDGNAQKSIKVKSKLSVIRAESVTITDAEDILYVGDEMKLDATIGTGGKGKPTVDGVIWSSSDASIATVDADGTVIGKKEGTVVITATSKDGYAKNSVTINVKPVLAKKITLNESAIRMKKGSSYKWLEVSFSPKNTTDQTVKWKSSNKKVATVTAKGVIKAKAVGTATITATTANGKKDTVKVTVTASNIKVNKIVLEKRMNVLAGDVIRLEPEVDPVNATNKKVSYKSSNTKVATVTNAGVVTAKAPGKATITVTAKDGTGKKATCVITVKAPDKTKITSVKSEAKKQVTLTWNEVENADGYVIYMSTSKKGNYKAVATINKKTTTTYTVKKLKSKQKCYFKVVSFVKAGDSKVYSNDSAVKSVKVK